MMTTVTGIGMRRRRSAKAGVWCRRLGMGGVLVLVTLSSGAPAGAGDEYPAPSFFASGLTPESSWSDILKARGVAADFPYIGFGNRFVPLTRTCLEGGALRPVDASQEGGPRVERQAARYMVNVYMVMPALNPLRMFLFQKPWEVPACPPR